MGFCGSNIEKIKTIYFTDQTYLVHLKHGLGRPALKREDWSPYPPLIKGWSKAHLYIVAQ